MSTKKSKNNKGFTLIETIIALALGLLATTMILYIFTVGLSHIRTIKNTENLHSNTMFFLNTLTYWVKQGKVFTVSPAHDTLTITLPNNTTTTIATSTFNTADVEVTALTFTPMSKSVQINFTMRAKNSSETISATTTIAQRAVQ